MSIFRSDQELAAMHQMAAQARAQEQLAQKLREAEASTYESFKNAYAYRAPETAHGPIIDAEFTVIGRRLLPK